MKKELLEQLSAGIDDELTAGEWPMLYRQMQSDPALRDRWDRYHLLGDALRAMPGRRADAGFASRVASALDTGRESGQAGLRRRWARSIVGATVAASVAAVALLSLRVDDPALSPEPGVVVPETENPQVVGGVRYAAGPVVQWERARPEVQAQLNGFLLDHADGVIREEREVTDDTPEGEPRP